jgi:hypothetical protein
VIVAVAEFVFGDFPEIGRAAPREAIPAAVLPALPPEMRTVWPILLNKATASSVSMSRMDPLTRPSWRRKVFFDMGEYIANSIADAQGIKTNFGHWVL